MKARTLLKKLTDYGLTVQVADDKIRLSPRQLINDKVLTFVRAHKNDLICALHDEHLERKRALHQRRLEVLRLILRRIVKFNAGGLTIRAHDTEAFLDDALKQFEYGIEKAIAHYRSIAPKPVIALAHCLKCSYRPLFCKCCQPLSKGAQMNQ